MDLNGRFVILAEDEENVRKMFERMLKRQGARLETAENGLEAIGRAAIRTPDVMILDLDMPQMGGIEAIRNLRSIDSTRDVPIVVLTALATQESVLATQDAGADGVVVKQDTTEFAFIERVAHAVAERRARTLQADKHSEKTST